jgi:hypothetical protein
MAGILLLIYDAKRGFSRGGDYEADSEFCQQSKNQGRRKTWDLMAENQGFGYASCIQYIRIVMGNH